MPVTINASTSSGLIATSDTSGDLALQANGSTKMTIGSSITMNSGGLITSATAQNSTSGTSIDFTGIPSWVKRITVMFNGVSTNGTSNPLVQLGAGSITSSGYVSSSGASDGSGATTSTAGFVVRSSGATNLLSGIFIISNVSSNIWVVSNNLYNSSGTGISIFGAGAVTLSSTLDRVRITTVNGTDAFDAGTINILYEG